MLTYLRSQNVVHRDLKPANLLLNEKWQLVVADFGTAKTVEPTSLSPTLAIRKSKSSYDVFGATLDMK